MNALVNEIKSKVEANGQEWTEGMQRAAEQTIQLLMPQNETFINSETDTYKMDYIVNNFEQEDGYKNAITCDDGKISAGAYKSLCYGIDKIDNLFSSDGYKAIIDTDKLTKNFQKYFNAACLNNAKEIDGNFDPKQK